MYQILIDTTNRYERSVKLINTKTQKTISEEKGEIDVINAILQILDQNKLTPKDIEKYIPNTGPGSFTGIKTGVTIANTLNWALKNKNTQVYEPKYGAEPNIDRSNERLQDKTRNLSF
jgi:tRNA A37 threonylcarbamoyladenosine modification protein TsaB